MIFLIRTPYLFFMDKKEVRNQSKKLKINFDLNTNELETILLAGFSDLLKN